MFEELPRNLEGALCPRLFQALFYANNLHVRLQLTQLGCLLRSSNVQTKNIQEYVAIIYEHCNLCLGSQKTK